MGIPDVLSYAYHVANIAWPALAVIVACIQAYFGWKQWCAANSSTTENMGAMTLKLLEFSRSFFEIVENAVRPLRERIERNETRVAETEQTVSTNVARVDTVDQRVDTIEVNHIAEMAAMAQKLDHVQKKLEEIEHLRSERPESYRDMGTQIGGERKSVGVQTRPTVRSSNAAPGQRRFESSTAASRARSLQ